MYKRLLSLLLLFCILLNVLPPGISTASQTSVKPVAVTQKTAQPVLQSLFEDVATSAWYYNAVMDVKQNNLFSGTSKDLFSPNATMSRAMFVTVLGRIAKIDASQYKTSVFTDVMPEDWYAPYVQWAIESGITNGTGNNKFSPDAAISREQMAVLILNYFESDRIPYDSIDSTSKPNDISDISSWAVDAAVTLWQVGLFDGDTNGKFQPRSNATRAEAAALFMRTNKVVMASNSITYTVTFNTNGGSPIDSLSLNRGESLNQLPLAFKDGLIFNGWYKDSSFTQPVMNHNTIKSDMTLYANYIASPNDAVKITPNTYAMDQSPSFKIAVKDFTGKMTAAAVQAGMTFKSPSNPDLQELL